MGFFDKIKKFLKIGNNNNTDNTISNPFIDSQAIESLSLACIKLDENLGLKSTGRCGICVKSINSDSFKQMKDYISEFKNNSDFSWDQITRQTVEIYEKNKSN